MDTPTGIVSCQVQIWTDIGRYVNAARRSRSDDARAKTALRVHVAEMPLRHRFLRHPAGPGHRAGRADRVLSSTPRGLRGVPSLGSTRAPLRSTPPEAPVGSLP